MAAWSDVWNEDYCSWCSIGEEGLRLEPIGVGVRGRSRAMGVAVAVAVAVAVLAGRYRTVQYSTAAEVEVGGG